MQNQYLNFFHLLILLLANRVPNRVPRFFASNSYFSGWRTTYQKPSSTPTVMPLTFVDCGTLSLQWQRQWVDLLTGPIGTSNGIFIDIEWTRIYSKPHKHNIRSWCRIINHLCRQCPPLYLLPHCTLVWLCVTLELFCFILFPLQAMCRKHTQSLFVHTCWKLGTMWYPIPDLVNSSLPSPPPGLVSKMLKSFIAVCGGTCLVSKSQHFHYSCDY